MDNNKQFYKRKAGPPLRVQLQWLYHRLKSLLTISSLSTTTTTTTTSSLLSEETKEDLLKAMLAFITAKTSTQIIQSSRSLMTIITTITTRTKVFTIAMELDDDDDDDDDDDEILLLREQQQQQQQCCSFVRDILDIVAHTAALQGMTHLALNLTSNMMMMMMTDDDNNDENNDVLGNATTATTATSSSSTSTSTSTSSLSSTTTTTVTAVPVMVPSLQCQNAIARALRNAGKLKQLEQFLRKVGVATTIHTATNNNYNKSTNTTMTTTTATSQFAYNMYLAALCDPFTDPNYNNHMFWAPVNATNLLEGAVRDWLDITRTRQVLGGLEPDSVSYTTVLRATTVAGRYDWGNEVWNQATRQLSQDQFTSQLYNARLQHLIQQQQQNNNHDHDNDQCDDQALKLWHALSSSATAATAATGGGSGDSSSSRLHKKIDRYTIDIILLPLLRAGRIGELYAVLDDFCTNNSEPVVADAFEAFLYTLAIKGQDVVAARAIFDSYIAPTLTPVVEIVNNSSKVVRWVRPRTKHFNLLLEGYKQLQQQQTEKSSAISSGDKSFYTDTSNETLSFARLGASDRGMTPETLGEQAWELFDIMRQSAPKIQPDVYAITTMMGLCRSPAELTDLLDEAIHYYGLPCSSVILRAAVTAYGDLGDTSSACLLFATFMEPQTTTTRYWNVLLGAIIKGSKVVAPAQNDPKQPVVLDVTNANARRILSKAATNRSEAKERLIEQLDGQTQWTAAHILVNDYVAQPNSQTFCLLAQAAQLKPSDAGLALGLYHNATAAGVPTDGRFANAVIRCFESDIDSAVDSWKNLIRPACVKYERRERSRPVPASRFRGKNLVAAYHALLYVSGRAMRPDVALRLVYAMAKEGLEPNEMALNCYKSGQRAISEPIISTTRTRQKLRNILKLNMVNAYESLLYVECVKYDTRDKRRAGEKKIRIIF